MLKTRILPTLLYKEPTLVKGVGFDSWRRVGSLMQAVKVYEMRQVDELVFLDIGASANGNPPDFDLVDEFADECFMPLTVGGGVASVEHVRRLLQVGADKVAVNSAALARPGLVAEIASAFGSQCVVASVDYRTGPDGRREVYGGCGRIPTGRPLRDWVVELAGLGAGEILLTCIERDGTMGGYDIEGIRAVSSAVDIPVIASGGAGSYEHMAEAVLDGGASAVAAASMFHFTEYTPLEAKGHLRSRGIPTRT